MSTSIDLAPYLTFLHIKNVDGIRKILCLIRKRWFVLTPEETVRQTCLHHLTALGYRSNHINVEKLLVVNSLRKRFDIVVFDRQAQPLILVECKAPSVSLLQKDMDQMSIYQSSLKAPLLWLTNGHHHYVYNTENTGRLKLLDELPTASD